MVAAGAQNGLHLFPGARNPAAVRALMQKISILPREAFTTELPRLEHLVPMGKIKLATVHHSGLPEPWLEDDFAATARHLEEIRCLHCDPAGRNWADIAYHYAVDRMGRVWQLRDLRFQGAHVKNHNSNNMGVVVLGNFDIQEPPPPQAATLFLLLQFIVRGYDLGGICTHQQIADTPTSCPGKHLRRLLDRHSGDFKKG
ncbi:MAG: peptidoglycan recognition protein family protein [Phycisphaerae bacterium]